MGCKTNGHIDQQQFNKLYVILCAKTLNFQYFKDFVINVHWNKELVVFEKKQYYIK